MLLSEMFGVKRDKPFMVIGLLSVYKIGTDAQGIERIERVNEYTSKSEVVCGSLVWRVIRAAPAGIIHLPPPLTDEQREQLKAIWTLGGRWLAKDFDDVVNYYTHKPYKKSGWWYVAKNDDGRYGHRIPLSSAVCKLQELDKEDEPYDIGKALGVGE